MIEPWVTPWSRIIYKYLHHEPFDPHETEWCFPPTGLTLRSKFSFAMDSFRERQIYIRKGILPVVEKSYNN